MKMLYTPWREEYTDTTAQGPKGQNDTTADDCVFCQHLRENNDDHHFILKRYEHTYIVLNRYPYNAGHILILPLEHKAHLYDFSSAVKMELMEHISFTTSVLQKELECHGLNVGINMGKAAGAGIPSHLHIHVLPRWSGDTNFLPIIGGTKVVSTNLAALYERLKIHFV